jgi:hypothetical protein
VANRGDIALRRVELARPQPQTAHLAAQGGQLLDADVQIGGACVEQRGDVLARRTAGVAHGKYLTNLGQGQPRSLSSLHELLTGKASGP